MSGGIPNSNMRDPMRNAALSSQHTAYEHDRQKQPVSDRKRKMAYVAIGVICLFLVSVIALFFIL